MLEPAARASQVSKLVAGGTGWPTAVDPRLSSALISRALPCFRTLACSQISSGNEMSIGSVVVKDMVICGAMSTRETVS